MYEYKSQTATGRSQKRSCQSDGPDREDEVPETFRSGGRPGLSLGVLAREVRVLPALSSLSESPRVHRTSGHECDLLPDWLSREAIYPKSPPKGSSGFATAQGVLNIWRFRTACRIAASRLATSYDLADPAAFTFCWEGIS